MIKIKSPEEIAILDRANSIVLDVLECISKELRPGLRLKEIDSMAEDLARTRGARPSFKGYKGYPASICVSVDDEVVHGIPGKRCLREGEIVSLDFGVAYEGYFGDAARTEPVGKVDEAATRIIDVTKEALSKGVQQMVEGRRIEDISWAIQSYVENQGFSVVRDYVGHGIGQEMHEEPQVPNYGSPGMGARIECGMVLAIEPMVNEGGHQVCVDEDGWTVRTKDHKRSAHFEYSVAVTPDGPKVLGVKPE